MLDWAGFLSLLAGDMDPMYSSARVVAARGREARLLLPNAQKLTLSLAGFVDASHSVSRLILAVRTNNAVLEF